MLLEAQGAQLQHLTTQLANSESLNDLNIEAIFHLEEDSATLQQKLYLSAEEVLSLTAQKGEALGKLKTLQDKMDAQTQQMASKDQEICDLNNHITDMKGMLQRADRLVANQKDTILRLRISDGHQPTGDCRSQLRNQKMEAEITTGSGEAKLHPVRSTSGSDTNPEHPIMSREKHTLAAGVANRLLNELRRELARTQQEKTDLLQTILRRKGSSHREPSPIGQVCRNRVLPSDFEAH